MFQTINCGATYFKSFDRQDILIEEIGIIVLDPFVNLVEVLLRCLLDGSLPLS
jgi:hypothetical protein